jgi:hypothetical protein
MPDDKNLPGISSLNNFLEYPAGMYQAVRYASEVGDDFSLFHFDMDVLFDLQSDYGGSDQACDPNKGSQNERYITAYGDSILCFPRLTI